MKLKSLNNDNQRLVMIMQILCLTDVKIMEHMHE